METIHTKFGKVVGKKRKRCANENESTAWSKRSVLFDFPYWKVRYNMVLNIK